MKQYSWQRGFCQLLCVLGMMVWVGQASAATLRVDVPAKVARGDAFLALAISETPVTQIHFEWNGKSFTFPAEEKEGQWQAVALFGVALEAKAQRMTLRVKAGAATAVSSVALYNRKRPVQKLTVDKKFVNPPKSALERIQRDRKKTAAVLARITPQRAWTVPFVRPVEGGVSSLFGLKRVFNGQPRGFHKGLDLRSPEGAPIKACADGVVALADNLYFSGNAVYLDHGLGVITSYLHMSKILVQPGEQVQRGQVIGLVGATGRVTGPHLHLSLFVQGTSVDIEPFLEKPAPKPTPAQAKS